MVVPTVLAYLGCHYSNYEPYPIIVNCGMFLIMIIAKIPEMHRVRIFSINSTPGIDNPVYLEPKKSRKNK